MNTDWPLNREMIERFNRYSRIIDDELSRSLVRICWVSTDRVPIDPERIESWRPTISFRSGFLINIGSRGWVCTAGHVVQQLRYSIGGDRKGVWAEVQYRESEKYFARVTLVDGGVHAEFRLDEKVGLDVGLIKLPSQSLQVLLGLGAKPIDVQAWSPPSFVPDLFVCVGYPKANRSETPVMLGDSVNFNTFQECPLIPLAPIRDEYIGSRQLQKFRGRILSRAGKLDGLPDGRDCVISSVNGMSGGPVFAIKLDQDRWHWQIAAILTDEQEEAGAIGGCFFGHLIKVLRGEL